MTAADRQVGDAVEKKVTVRPYGEERVATATQIFRSSTTLEMQIPENALSGSISAELKIYPNHMAHVMESVEAVMSRPHGCGEQTISSAYPSVLLLKYAPNADTAVKQRARRYVQIGYERLLSYRAPSGGFTYWGRGEPDVSLTAYALRFLTDASALIAVDDSLVQETHSWLLRQIGTNGAWDWHGWGGYDNTQRTAIQTAYVARVLAAYGALQRGKWNVTAQAAHDRAMQRSLEYLERVAAQFDEPYMLASLALAARDAGRAELAEEIAGQLTGMAHSENGGAYWALKTNTPFYGWGFAGRVETTALVVRALLQSGDAEKPAERAAAADRGLLFLLRAKDRHGVWYSTQSTINVLETLLASIAEPAGSHGKPSAANIIVNGKPAGVVELPPSAQLSAPLTLDVTRHLHAGANKIEITREVATSSATVQVVASSYVPWPQVTPVPAGSADGLRLAVVYHRTQVEVGGEVRCTVRAERVGHRGYGMMLAEIGLPPGAEVDRASLQRAMEESNWSIGRYDVLPDRVVLYLWPRAGGVNFNFTLRPRFGMSAKTTASILYDYYNPEERAVLAPTHFTVQEPRRLP